MNVFIISETAYRLGGAEVVALKSAKGLAERGHQVTVLAAEGPADPDLENVPNLRVLYVEEPEGEKMAPHKTRQFWRKGPRELVKKELAKADKNDSVIHFHSGANLFGASSFGPLADAGIPIIYTHHDFGWGCPMQGFYNMAKQRPCGVRGGSLKCFGTCCPGNARFYRYKVYRFLRHQATHNWSGIEGAVRQHIFVSKTSQERLMPYLPHLAKTQVVPNPIEVEKRDPARIEAGAPFTFVGRMTAEKDPVTLARAAKAANVPVLFIGDGPMTEQVRNANPDAEFTGWLPPQAVQERIRSSRAVVMTSRCYETQGMVIPEAFSAGIPVIAPTVTAAPEYVKSGETGFLFEAGDVAQLAHLLADMDDVELARRMGANAYRQFWDDAPTLEAHLNRLETIYEQCVGTEGAMRRRLQAA
ncbi:MAG TPA: glycosyltransferase family 4 protein [Fimbriimonas sp.]|nr:glycosyltransferase family 4 protein [Fimbriimonas sp.]